MRLRVVGTWRTARFALLGSAIQLLLFLAPAAGAGARTLGSPGSPTTASSVGGSTGPAPLPTPGPLTSFVGSAVPAQGQWRPYGRPVGGHEAVYETTLVPPGGAEPAGIAWMDTRLLRARLYSGSVSPGGGPYHFTAPIEPAQARTLVAAFNGGFQMSAAQGGYYTEGRTVYPLRAGAASLVIYSGGSVALGAWGLDVGMTPRVVAVRQNLVPLVDRAQPAPLASTPNWLVWGATCGAYSCSGPGIENQWRSGLGITADGALVYVAGPSLDPLQLAQLLVRAGAVRAMELDINPYWPDFVTYRPTSPYGLAAPGNGTKLLATMTQGPATFFTPSWARDFVTMSGLPATSRR